MSMTREELIDLLSEMHKGGSKDVGVLAGSTFHDFDQNHPRFSKLPSLQPALFNLCKDELTGYK